MKYEDFRKRVADYPYFRSNLFPHLTDKPAVLRRQLVDWVRQGRVITLKRGLYTLRDADRNVKFSLFYLAEQLYHPSYISLESALGYYGMIPEGVYATISITTKKTQCFENAFGQFLYRHIQPDRYTGFVTVLDEFGNPFNIAEKERALVDFFYFQSRSIEEISPDIFIESFRLQNLEGLKIYKLKKHATIYKNQKLSKIVTLFIQELRLK